MSKKKAKRQKEYIRVNKYDEVRDFGWYEVLRKGKNVFMRNKMTTTQHQQWIKQIQENRPKLYEDIQQRIIRVSNLINSYDKIFVIAGIASIAAPKMANPYEEDDSTPEVTVEYCQSIATATPNTNVGKQPSNAVLNEIYQELAKIRSDLRWYYVFEHVDNKFNEVQHMLRSDIIGETLYIRGEGYQCHIEELFEEMFRPHDRIFEEHYGFKSSDIVNTFKQLESSFTLRVLMPNDQPHPFFLHKLQQWDAKLKGEKRPYEEFAKEAPGVIVENGSLMLYPMGLIPYFDKLYKIYHYKNTQEKVVKAIAMEFGENKAFLDRSPCAVLNDTEIYIKPILKVGDNYYLFSMNLGPRNYFSIAIDLLKTADLSYFNKSFLNNRVMISKDRFVEEKVLRLFQKMLPSVKFYDNAYYYYPSPKKTLKCTERSDGNYELDILGISENATYIIEVKAGLFNKKARNGAMLTLQSELSKLIGDAICQSYRAYNYIVDTEECKFTIKDKKLVAPVNRKKVFRISVSFSYIGTMISSPLKLQEFEVIEKGAEFAWTVNIYDLMAFSDIIDSELELIDYLTKRIPLYNDKRLVNMDETALLGLYYSEDLIFHKDYDYSDSLQLDSRSYTRDIDLFFEGRGPKPRKKIDRQV